MNGALTYLNKKSRQIMFLGKIRNHLDIYSYFI